MKYGYDMNNREERQKYFEQKKKELQRTTERSRRTGQEDFAEIIKERQELFKFFEEKETFEEYIQNKIENALAEILKDFKFQ